MRVIVHTRRNETRSLGFGSRTIKKSSHCGHIRLSFGDLNGVAPNLMNGGPYWGRYAEMD